MANLAPVSRFQEARSVASEWHSAQTADCVHSTKASPGRVYCSSPAMIFQRRVSLDMTDAWQWLQNTDILT